MATKELNPELRFPGFTEDWKNEPLSTVLTEHGRKNKKADCEVFSVSQEKGLVNQIEHLGRSFSAKDTSNYNKAGPHDIVYTKSPLRDYPYGIVKQSKLDKDVAVSPLYGVFAPKNKHVGTIVEAHFESTYRSKSFIGPLAQKGAKNTINITNTTFLSGKMTLPGSEAEQQKIADCLSSLDELIAAHSRKLAALQDHKKGLLQQLFPAEGETTPKLRFPEFRDSGEWGQHVIKDIFDTATGGTPDRKKSDYWKGDIPWITTSLVNFSVITKAEEFITKEAIENSSAKSFPPDTILIAMYGQGKTRGQVAMLGMHAATNQACAAILPNKDAVPNFVFQNLANRYSELRSLSNDGGQKNLSQGLIRELPISLPKKIEEQQKIADCLSDLDALITAQTKGIAALKEHKKGLMQQLFPNPN